MTTTQTHTTRNVLLIIAALVLLPVLAVGGFAGYLWISGTPLWDEWYCADGEAPYDFADGGSACAPEGSELPDGATWDPLGNRPMSCEDRWGWTEVERVPNVDGGTDCLEKGRPLPEGWRRVD